MNGSEKISYHDIMFVIDRLLIFYGEHNRIIMRRLEYSDFPFFIYANEMGIDAKKLFQKNTIVEFLLPEAFQMNELQIDFSFYMAAARFSYLPPLSRFIQYEGVNIDESQQYEGLSIGFSEECYFEKPDITYADEELAYECAPFSSARILGKGQELPKGAKFASFIFIHDDNAAVIWMGLLADIMNYYIAAIEPLVKGKSVSPTLSEIDNLHDTSESAKKEILKAYRKRCFSFKLFLDEAKREAIRRAYQRSGNYSAILDETISRDEANHNHVMSKILTKTAVCEYLGWTKNTLNAHIAKNPGCVVHIGRQHWRFDTSLPAFADLPHG